MFLGFRHLEYVYQFKGSEIDIDIHPLNAQKPKHMWLQLFW